MWGKNRVFQCDRVTKHTYTLTPIQPARFVYIPTYSDLMSVVPGPY